MQTNFTLAQLTNPQNAASEKILRKQTFSADFTVLKRFRML